MVKKSPRAVIRETVAQSELNPTHIQERISEVGKPSIELMNKVNGLKQLINIHDLLNTGTFPGHMNKRIGEGVDMVTQLHKQLLEEVMADDDAHLVPGLLNK